MKAYQYNITDELIVDNFAGGGGASTGIELATGRIVDIAVNHDRAAIEMHEKNHPYTRHFCEDVWEIDPRKVTAGDHNQLLGATLVKYYSGEEQAQSVNAPLHTITTEPRFYLATSHIATFRRGMDGQSVGEPLSTITAKAGHHAEVRTYLTKIGSGDTLLGNWNEVRDLLNTYAGYKIAADEILIIEINGVQYFISDVAMRMLEPHELAAAQGFPPDYVLKVSESYSKSAQIARIGNSVVPIMATVLVRANLPELCVRKKLETMKDLDKVLTA